MWRGVVAAAESEPLLLDLQKVLQALLRTAATLHALTETATEVDAFCNSLEAVLGHKFKSKQFYLFTVHPWAMIEHSENYGAPEEDAVKLARSVGSSDAARLRAWTYVQLNQRSLQQSLCAILEDEALRAMFFSAPGRLPAMRSLIRPPGPRASPRALVTYLLTNLPTHRPTDRPADRPTD